MLQLVDIETFGCYFGHALFEPQEGCSLFLLMLLTVLFSPSRSPSLHNMLIYATTAFLQSPSGWFCIMVDTFEDTPRVTGSVFRETQVPPCLRFFCRSTTGRGVFVGLSTVGLMRLQSAFFSDWVGLRITCSRTLHLKYTLEHLENLSFLLNLMFRPTSLKSGPARDRGASKSGY